MSKQIVVFPENRSRPISVVGEQITVLASGQEADSYELFIQEGVEGAGAPPHTHDWDESFFVLNGNVKFGIENEEMLATEGTLIHFPPGLVHWFKFEKGGGQMLSITGQGSRASAFFNQAGREKIDGTDFAAFVKIGSENGVSILD